MAPARLHLFEQRFLVDLEQNAQFTLQFWTYNTAQLCYRCVVPTTDVYSGGPRAGGRARERVRMGRPLSIASTGFVAPGLPLEKRTVLYNFPFRRSLPFPCACV